MAIVLTAQTCCPSHAQVVGLMVRSYPSYRPHVRHTWKPHYIHWQAAMLLGPGSPSGCVPDYTYRNFTFRDIFPLCTRAVSHVHVPFQIGHFPEKPCCSRANFRTEFHVDRYQMRALTCPTASHTHNLSFLPTMRAQS